MKISKSKLKKIIIEQIELASLQSDVDSIFNMISKEIDKIPPEAQGVIWSAIMSKIAEEAKSEDDIKEVSSEKQRRWACAQKDKPASERAPGLSAAEAEEMCKSKVEEDSCPEKADSGRVIKVRKA